MVEHSVPWQLIASGHRLMQVYYAAMIDTIHHVTGFAATWEALPTGSLLATMISALKVLRLALDPGG